MMLLVTDLVTAISAFTSFACYVSRLFVPTTADTSSVAEMKNVAPNASSVNNSATIRHHFVLGKVDVQITKERTASNKQQSSTLREDRSLRDVSVAQGG